MVLGFILPPHSHSRVLGMSGRDTHRGAAMGTKVRAFANIIEGLLYRILEVTMEMEVVVCKKWNHLVLMLNWI